MTAKAAVPAVIRAPKPADAGALYRLPGHLIRRCHQISVALFFEECAGFDITPQQYAALGALAANDGVDQITLAGLAAFNRTTAGEIVERMETAGLVKRRNSTLDRRMKNIFITDVGRRLLADVDGAVLRVQERLLTPLEPAERARFIEFLARIADENNELSRAPLRPIGKGARGKRGLDGA
ncbi:MAG TPA: MarR family winged helix-turn-helix transcriptional regulator [Casimicrobiaceae bacterium]|nr:MarR family winged helix-turn-helix transcriptional regulator [Casimicrobiaceae bacterium]